MFKFILTHSVFLLFAKSFVTAKMFKTKIKYPITRIKRKNYQVWACKVYFPFIYTDTIPSAYSLREI